MLASFRSLLVNFSFTVFRLVSEKKAKMMMQIISLFHGVLFFPTVFTNKGDLKSDFCGGRITVKHEKLRRLSKKARNNFTHNAPVINPPGYFRDQCFRHYTPFVLPSCFYRFSQNFHDHLV